MKVALIHNARLPIDLYGGTERVVWWLSKGLNAQGTKVILICQEGSHCPYAEVRPGEGHPNLASEHPDIQLFHYFNTPSFTPPHPHLVTIGGNGKAGEKFLPNTVFVSANHAKRHNASCFVHNGLDPDEYQFQQKKQDYLIFLGKASWGVKNVKGAIRIARSSHRPLHILGGKRLFLNRWRKVYWEGMVGGAVKASLISNSAGLLFPVLWNEPFGLAVTESLVSGTPVIATPFGSLPELVPPEVGTLCQDEPQFIEAVSKLDRFNPKTCRDWIMTRFTHLQMARHYRQLYERVLSGENLNEGEPHATEDQGKLLSMSPQPD